MGSRTVVSTVLGRPTSDGGGVRLMRMISPEQGLDPFLLLDEFNSASADDYIAGFPSHPHRGFETVTYMLDGHMLHEDHLGNRGDLLPGAVQWMTAGRGIIHSEMPQQTAGRMRGFQLWINLPAAKKMQAASYQDIAPERVPVLTLPQARLRVIAGSCWPLAPAAAAVAGPVGGGVTAPVYWDLQLEAAADFVLATPPEHRVLAYVYDGQALIGGTTVTKGQLAILSLGDQLAISANMNAGLLVIGGRPLQEPVVHYGPFVMNSRQEIETALNDYRAGTLTSPAG